MGHVVDIKVGGLKELGKRLGVALDRSVIADMNRTIGMDSQARIAEHIADASNSRHKTADALGAEHSKFLEWSPGRGLLESTSKYKPRPGEDAPYLKAKDWDVEGVRIVIGNTPGLSRAYHDLTIEPKNGKKWLTIPKSPISYSLRVADLKGMGWEIYRPWAKKGKTERPKVLLGKRGGTGKPELLYILCGKVTVPKDEGLLPKDEVITKWACDAAEEYIEAYEELNG